MTQLAAWLPTLLTVHAFVACWVLWARRRARRTATESMTTKFRDTLQRCRTCQEHSAVHSPPSTILLSWHSLQKTVLHARGRRIRHGVESRVCDAQRVLLAGVSGFVRAGDLHGLVGPSGAGKSTLLELLSGSHQADRSTTTSGTVNSQSASPSSLTFDAQSKQQQLQTFSRRDGQKSPGSSQGCSNCEHQPIGTMYASNASLDSNQHQANTSICYVPQHDLLLPTLTTYETLCFFDSLAVINDKHQVLPSRLQAAGIQAGSDTAATLQHGNSRRTAGGSSRVQWLINVMGLRHCADIQVGGVLPGGHSLRGLSGGERKRLAIAVGLMPHIQHPSPPSHCQWTTQGLGSPVHDVATQPLVVLCDEPTSGLDGTCALSVMDLLKQLAAPTPSAWGEVHHYDTGCTLGNKQQQDIPCTVCMPGIIHQPCAVIAAIHQPRPAIWRLLDTVSVLASGKLVYFGPSEELSSWLSDCAGWTPYCPDRHGSIPDYVLEGVCGGFPKSAQPLQPSASTQDHSCCGSRASSGRSTADMVNKTAQNVSAYLKQHGLFWWSERCKPTQLCQSQHVPPSTQTFTPKCATSSTLTGDPADKNTTADTHNRTDASTVKTESTMSQVEAFTSLPSGQCVTGVPVGQTPNITPSSTYPSLCITQAANQVHITFGPNNRGLISLKSGSFAPSVTEEEHGNHLSGSHHHTCGGSTSQPVHRRISKRAQTTLPSTTSCTHIDLVADATGSIHIHASMQLVCHDNLHVEHSCWTPATTIGRMANLSATCCHVVRATTVRVTHVAVRWGGLVRSRVLKTARQTALLCWRDCNQLYHDPWTTALKVLLSTWSAFTLGLVLYDLDGNVGLEGIQLRAAAMFLNCSIQLCLPYVSLMAYTANAAQTRREGETGMYGPMAALLSKLAMTVPVNMACVAAYTLTAYGMQGLRHGAMYIGTHLGLAWLLVLCSAQVMHLSVVACPSVDTAFMITTSWGVLNMYLSGFFVRADQLQLRWLAPLRYLSAVRLAFQGMLKLELRNALVPCGQPDGWKRLLMIAPPVITLADTSASTSMHDSTTAGLFEDHAFVLTQDSGSTQDSGISCLVDGNLALQLLGVDNDNAGVVGDAAGLLAYLAGLLLLTCVLQVTKWPCRSRGAAMK